MKPSGQFVDIGSGLKTLRWDFKLYSFIYIFSAASCLDRNSSYCKYATNPFLVFSFGLIESLQMFLSRQCNDQYSVETRIRLLLLYSVH